MVVTFVTNQGLIPMQLNRAEAPCTVQSFLHLLTSGFYDDTICHRLTTYPTLSVLQCGDPSGTGEGGPGYQFRDELPTNLPVWPGDPADSPRRVYARGTLAMANAGPDTNGSQFFLVYKDSRLRPNYTIFGRILPVGLRTLDRIAAGGVDPNDPGAPLDGLPALSTHIYVGLPEREQRLNLRTISRRGRQTTSAVDGSAKPRRSGTGTMSPAAPAENTRRAGGAGRALRARSASSSASRLRSACTWFSSSRIRLMPARFMPSCWDSRCTSRSWAMSRAE